MGFHLLHTVCDKWRWVSRPTRVENFGPSFCTHRSMTSNSDPLGPSTSIFSSWPWTSKPRISCWAFLDLCKSSLTSFVSEPYAAFARWLSETLCQSWKKLIMISGIQNGGLNCQRCSSPRLVKQVLSALSMDVLWILESVAVCVSLQALYWRYIWDE